MFIIAPYKEDNNYLSKWKWLQQENIKHLC